jgi:hypothetical protein
LTDIQQREEHWAIVDLVGKGGHIRTLPIPDWVWAELDHWLASAGSQLGAHSPDFLIIIIDRHTRPRALFVNLRPGKPLR